MVCARCGAEVATPGAPCSLCGSPPGALARTGGDSLLDRQVEAMLAKVSAETALARTEGLSSLARDEATLGLRDLDAAIDRLQARDDEELRQLQTLLVREEGELGSLDLAALLDHGHSKALLKTGLVLLRKGRLREAAEWWSLQRAALDPSQGKLELLFLVLEAWTLALAGEHLRAAALRKSVLGHRHYPEIRPQRE